ncbi:MAG: CheR family methyltransferase [Myxococcota bacterium]
MSLSAGDLQYIRDLVRDHAAIVLDDSKEYLVRTRLGPVARTVGEASLPGLVSRLRRERFGGLHETVLEALTTNETSFFRDGRPFELLRTHVLPQILSDRGPSSSLRIWSAASSTGQEPYSIAMLLREHFPDVAPWRVRIRATDLSKQVLERAREGLFTQLEVNRGLPARYLVKYFRREGTAWRVRDEVRSLVRFEALNLARPWPSTRPWDVIFIRNVLIYFGAETKREILRRLRGALAPGGYVFFGGAETPVTLDDAYERVQIDRAVCYRARTH